LDDQSVSLIPKTRSQD